MRLLAGQRVDMRIGAGGFEQLVEILGQGREALLVIGLAAQARDGDVVDARARGNAHSSTPPSNTAAQGRSTWPPAAAHTIPHFRRSSHSEERSSRSSRNITGMFHRSLVSRMVMPASEYGISFARLGKILGLPVASAGLRGEFLQQFAILLGVEVFGDAVHALERQNVAPNLLRSAASLAWREWRYFGDVGAGLFGGPFRLETRPACWHPASGRPPPPLP